MRLRMQPGAASFPTPSTIRASIRPRIHIHAKKSYDSFAFVQQIGRFFAPTTAVEVETPSETPSSSSSSNPSSSSSSSPSVVVDGLYTALKGVARSVDTVSKVAVDQAKVTREKASQVAAITAERQRLSREASTPDPKTDAAFLAHLRDLDPPLPATTSPSDLVIRCRDDDAYLSVPEGRRPVLLAAFIAARDEYELEVARQAARHDLRGQLERLRGWDAVNPRTTWADVRRKVLVVEIRKVLSESEMEEVFLKYRVGARAADVVVADDGSALGVDGVVARVTKVEKVKQQQGGMDGEEEDEDEGTTTTFSFK